MSNKPVSSNKKQSLSRTAKMTIGVLVVLGLELSAIAAAVKIMEYRQSYSTPKYQALEAQISAQTQQLADLRRLSVSISTVSQQISANSTAINLISDNLNALKEEVGNNQMRAIRQQIDATEHRLETLEEERSKEALILSVALMIKENALYSRSFADEADVLAKLSADLPQISSDISTILQFKEKDIVNDEELSKAYTRIAKDFSFETEVIAEPQEEDALKKGINLLKDSASHIKLDKLIVLKKQKKTDEQIKLLNTLNSLVNNYKFEEALKYISDNSEFGKISSPAFVQWQQDVRESITFNKALSHIISQQLIALRQDVKKGTIKISFPLSEPKENVSSKSASNERSDVTDEGNEDAKILK